MPGFRTAPVNASRGDRHVMQVKPIVRTESLRERDEGRLDHEVSVCQDFADTAVHSSGSTTDLLLNDSRLRPRAGRVFRLPFVSFVPGRPFARAGAAPHDRWSVGNLMESVR